MIDVVSSRNLQPKLYLQPPNLYIQLPVQHLPIQHLLLNILKAAQIQHVQHQSHFVPQTQLSSGMSHLSE